MEPSGRNLPTGAARVARTARTLVFTVGCMLVVARCARVEPPADRRPTISADVFVEAMVALRTSFALNDQGVLAPGASDAILQERGLTPDQLEMFVEVHGGDVPLMADIWTRIELAVDSANGRFSEVEADPDR